ncbi:MAG: class I SAM-dependent methyltransferase [Actinomycetota bacterium]
MNDDTERRHERPDAATVLASVADVDGWMTHAQGEALFEAARVCPPGGTIVEIGSFRGRSTIVLAAAADPAVRVVAIDPHAGNDRGPEELNGFEAAASDDHELFLANLRRAGVAERVEHLRIFSHDAHTSIDGEIDVLYVDGAHRYHPALDDIRSWGDRVRPGGSMLIHDSFSSIGVTLAILRTLVPGSRFRYVGRRRSLAIYRADLGHEVSERVANAGRQLAQLAWFVKNVALKIVLRVGGGRIWALVGCDEPEWPY